MTKKVRYTTANNNTVCIMNDFELQQCIRLTNKLLGMEICRPFKERVDPARDGAQNYYDIILEPMDLGQIQSKLNSNEYKSMQKWRDDVMLVWKNAQLFNKEGSLLYLISLEMEQWFIKKFKKIPKNKDEEWMQHLNKASRKLKRIISTPPGELISVHQPVLINSKHHSSPLPTNDEPEQVGDTPQENDLIQDSIETVDSTFY